MTSKPLRRLLLGLLAALASASAWPGVQVYEPLAADVRAGLAASIADRSAPRHGFARSLEAVDWLDAMSQRLARRMPDFDSRLAFLKTLHYEATRAGLDPQLVLAVVQVESGFKKYAVSSAGARGYMQVMPFWIKVIGTPAHNLFNFRTNLRYGCVILRHYLDIEKGDVSRALGRYNGSLGKPEYPNLVLATMKQAWAYDPASRARTAEAAR